MKNQSGTLPGELWVWASNTKPPWNRVAVTDRFQFSLNASPVLRGDRHKPMPHSYRSIRGTGPSGMVFVRKADSQEIWRGDLDGVSSASAFEIAMSAQLDNLLRISADDSVTAAYNSLFGIDLTTSVIETARGGVKPAETLVSIAYESVGAEDPFKETHSKRRHASKKFAGAYVQFKKTNPKLRIPEKVNRVIKNVGKTVLINNYVVQPLIGDIVSSMNHLRHKLDRKAFEVKGSASKSGRRSLRRAYLPIPGTRQEISADLKAKAHTKLRYRVPSASYDTVAQLASFSPLNVGYQLIPLSFVVDWFYDVGGWLQQVEARAAYNHLYDNGYTSVIGVADAEMSVLPDHSTVSGGFRGGKYKQISFTRSTHPIAPGILNPRLNTDLSSGRMLNAAALLSQLLNK